MNEYENLSHFSVMLNESIEYLKINENGTYLDCTLGGAGHSSEILKRLKNGKLYCFDQDKFAIEKAKKRLETISNNFEIINDNFENIDSIDELFDGILYDLGVSSFQFDDSDRGFSYRFDAVLDMRMNPDGNLSAYDVVNGYELDKLCKIFREYGEEKFAYQIAKNICKARENKKIETTFELVEIIKKSLPAKELRKTGHPAKQVFQAIRIEVNDELGVLERSLEKALKMLKVGGRIVVITFHSLEDRIVKNIFKKYTTLDLPKGLPFIPEGYSINYQIINKHVIEASEEELLINNRSHSAKMRVIERIK